MSINIHQLLLQEHSKKQTDRIVRARVLIIEEQWDHHARLPWPGPKGAEGPLVSQSFFSIDFYCRAFGEKGTLRSSLPKIGEGRTIEPAEITFHQAFAHGIDLPSGMGYLVFVRLVSSGFCIAPEMFGDEFFLAAFLQGAGTTGSLQRDGVPATLVPPVIGREKCGGVTSFHISHGQRNIAFPEKGIGHPRDRPKRHDLADEDHAPFPLSAVFVTDIKTQIDLGKMRMIWDTPSPDPDLSELEAYQAYIRIAGPGV